jgi:hypothetical protein
MMMMMMIIIIIIIIIISDTVKMGAIGTLQDHSDST